MLLVWNAKGVIDININSKKKPEFSLRIQMILKTRMLTNF